MKTRVISAVVLLCLVGVCFFLSPVSRALFLMAAAMLAVWEMSEVQLRMGRDLPRLLLLLYLLAHTALCLLLAPLWALVSLFSAVEILLLSLCVVQRRFGAEGAVGGLFALLYPSSLFAVIIRLSLSEYWLVPFATAALATWLCDAFALFGGMRFGKHKLSPAISPHKTVEGSLCGAAMSLLGGVVVWALLRAELRWLPVYLLTALIGSTMGQVGDLAASLFKREAGIKDYSNLIPGHGGVMDRVDSLLFSIPTAWLCLKLAELLLS